MPVSVSVLPPVIVFNKWIDYSLATNLNKIKQYGLNSLMKLCNFAFFLKAFQFTFLCISLVILEFPFADFFGKLITYLPQCNIYIPV